LLGLCVAGRYPYDNVTGFRLDKSCAFECPHRHFSHLLQMYDLETIEWSDGANATLDELMHKSLDNWYRVTCNESNVFNEECRGFTQCGMSAMSAVTGRADAAVGNITALLDTVATPNGMCTLPKHVAFPALLLLLCLPFDLPSLSRNIFHRSGADN
jgi:hypothetical protein